MKAVIYARYSSSSQTEQSIEGQLRVCNDYAKNHNLTVVKNYIDRAKTGTSDNRADFQKMINDSDKHIFDVVIVYKTDRFARNRYDSAIYKARLKKNGVKVLYAQEHIPDAPEGIILESLLEGMAEYYSAELSQKIKRGIRESALKCRAVGGQRILGYQVAPDKTFEIDPVTAPLVKKIYEMYDSGSTLIDICRALNDQGFKSATGAKFNKNSLNTILKNEKYIGVYKCNDIRIPGGMPIIIENDLFERVQKKIIQNKKTPGTKTAKVNFLLSGKLYCGKCGGGMIGGSATGRHGGKFYYYVCSNRKRLKTCDKANAKKDWLENLVVDETIKHVLNPDKIEIIAKRCVEISVKEKSNNAELDLLKNQLSEVQKSIENIMNAIEQGIITRNTKILCFVNSVHLYDDKLLVTYNLTDKEKNELESSLIDILANGGNVENNNISVCSPFVGVAPPKNNMNKNKLMDSGDEDSMIINTQNLIELLENVSDYLDNFETQIFERKVFLTVYR